MGTGPTSLADPFPVTARMNGAKALTLLAALMHLGLRRLVLCPGSRSAPLAVAAALLETHGLALLTGIDERSAAFLALGMSRGDGRPAAVVTTSGTAVAELLPAAVEADLGTIPLLLISADRPARLKGCGANQAVPQEAFLQASCRSLLEGPALGLTNATTDDLQRLAAGALGSACGEPGIRPAGPVHLNLPFEEPLHCDGSDLAWLKALTRELMEPASGLSGVDTGTPPAWAGEAVRCPIAPRLDATRPGVVVAGPWRGNPADWSPHVQALRSWLEASGWALLADPLSGLRGLEGIASISGYDLLLERPTDALASPQILRLGSLPASMRLQRWLQQQKGPQVLVSPGDPRRLDPLAAVAEGHQWPGGLATWLADQTLPPAPPVQNRVLTEAWSLAEARAQAHLERRLGNRQTDASETRAPTPIPLSEPWLARQLSRLLPAGLPLLLASSSPVRDWEAFADPKAPWRPVHGFRGASGIDGTLSIACGLAEALGQLVLLSGDLALLHDANGWLWTRQLRGRLTVVLIENGGGGIFEQLPIRTEPPDRLDFERLFAMPQPIDQLALAALHGVPGRRIMQPADLQPALTWALAQPVALLELRTRRGEDATLRQRLRREIAQENGTAGS
jgi:2-succinyl-5-enolpyruvyl-6-hydroxy-3-cyclohexene-1-carboxylate synthase